ncbi:MAG: DUF2865 domain-containing protein [Xanthobacteraceae bacterium]
MSGVDVTNTRSFARAVSLSAISALAAVSLVGSTAPASAQLFNFLFGSPRGAPPSASAYANPFPTFNPFDRLREREPARHSGSSGGSVVFCVRLCDGRYFPVQRHRNSNAAEVCSSFCPASPTKTFSGSRIDHASASDGARYASLENAFAYRERVVENCTCNGRDAYGLVNGMSAAEDPTLRKGDIVATNTGFVAYNGNRQQQAEFTPVESYPGVSSDWRQRLAETRIVPANATPVPPKLISEGLARGRSAQLEQ